jgi:tetratricopeptide (TPR) repeat protein
VVLAAVAAMTGCARDAAMEEYLAALRGEEQGMTREEQIAHLDRAIAVAPRRSVFWETRATYRIDLRDFVRARADLDEAIRLGDRPYLRFMRGLVWCQQGDCGRSLPDFDAAIAGHPANSQFYRGRSLARTAIGDPVRGLEDAERLVSMARQQAESHHARGLALAGLGRHDEAIAEYDTALAQRPELVYPLTSRAASLEALGHAALADADRRLAARRAEEESRCAPCVDPFRY